MLFSKYPKNFPWIFNCIILEYLQEIKIFNCTKFSEIPWKCNWSNKNYILFLQLFFFTEWNLGKFSSKNLTRNRNQLHKLLLISDISKTLLYGVSLWKDLLNTQILPRTCLHYTIIINLFALRLWKRNRTRQSFIFL